MQCQWVIGRYEGLRAEWVQLHAERGIGYFIQKSEGKGRNRTILAAFQRPMDGPLPEHLEEATSVQIDKLEALYAKRHSDRPKKQRSQVVQLGEVSGYDMFKQQRDDRSL